MKLGYIYKFDILVPHKLKAILLTAPLNICNMLIKRQENDPFLKRLITLDDKWTVYNYVM